jgi:hypothetical protein
MNSTTVEGFWQLYRKLPRHVREAAREAYRHFRDDPSHPALRFHRPLTAPQLWSVRITRDCRAVGLVKGDTITWFWVGNHQDFDQEFPR